MRKAFMGVRLRRLREERNLKQVELAGALGISASYLNQLEQNQRPLTVPVLLKINAVFGVDVQLFSEDEEARLITDLRDALSDGTEAVSVAEVRELALNMPAVGRTLVALHRRYREAAERSEAMAAQLGDDWISGGPARMPFEQVRDFFYARHNHVEPLDEAAERLYRRASLTPRTIQDGVVKWLREKHGVEVVRGDSDTAQRRYDPLTRTLHISANLKPGQQTFQMATQLAFLELGEEIDRLADDRVLAGDEARRLARVGLANYFAGALILPYSDFLAAAEQEAYDIEKLGRRFGVGFETVCHRLSTLQRADARGVPFFFIRVDRAGNISKRQSATDFHFSRVGGSCPLWNVYEAFAQPGRVLTQVAQMPDGRTYLWVARTVGSGNAGYGVPGKTFAVGLGCDIRHASRLVYSRGLDLANPDMATPIGAGCKVCERPNCLQRAFPPIGRAVTVDENRSTTTPYPVG
ncbi:short-chain fatty acyl-CoA regulator family protein [Novosphingobium resinovorum]|uniref:short-chain fatty acyl-CoA regulator family protein n=1 Tax=Novosphingobium TaxID=165696 RepID=UPI001B3C73A2|nr:MULTISPECIES: short-chain fatty acyl-CoA regulator family protein [Novosphingobium]MBF7014017.1 XRE family transcriptional regulator [Novosphingobium sp. HR1a]WJM26159.1 short-chain fatty acyl-CoA regulator family protein [Novosphingobium resinovorum]